MEPRYRKAADRDLVILPDVGRVLPGQVLEGAEFERFVKFGLLERIDDPPPPPSPPKTPLTVEEDFFIPKREPKKAKTRPEPPPEPPLPPPEPILEEEPIEAPEIEAEAQEEPLEVEDEPVDPLPAEDLAPIEHPVDEELQESAKMERRAVARRKK